MLSSTSQRIIFVLLSIQCAISYETYVTRLRGSNKFTPCVYQKRAGEHDIVCDHKASQRFGTELPSIELEGVAVDRVQISGNARITRCVAGTFITTEDKRSETRIRQLEIVNSSLTDIEPDCFKGLNQLERLAIENADVSIQSTNSSVFHVFRYLVNLRELHLVNFNLPDIPANAFSNWGTQLKRIRLINNQLLRIADDAFVVDNTSQLEELHLGRQIEGWTLLSNANRWARPLTALRALNLTGMLIHPQKGVVTIDLGKYVNQNLNTLSLNNCSITNLLATDDDGSQHEGVRLAPDLASQLRRLYLDHNRFHMIRPNKSSLDGLYELDNLEVLSLQQNQVPLYSLPNWMGTSRLSRLRELYLAQNGLKYVAPRAFPLNIQVLDISANPLRYVDSRWVVNLVGLRELYMNRIRLNGVNVGGKRAAWTKALQPVTSTLDILSLSGCQLQSEMLIFSKKQTPILDLNTFKQLRTLILDSNRLNQIPNKMIDELVHLKTLSVTRNKLKDLITSGSTGQRMGKKRPRLTWVDVRYNELQTLDRCAMSLGFEMFLDDLLPAKIASPDEQNDQTGEVLQGFGLTGNPITCDCRVAWLSRYLKKMRQRKGKNELTDATFERLLDFTCADVGRWERRQFVTLKPEDLYAVDHEHCREKPEVYGRPTRPDDPLPVCPWQNVTRIRGGMGRMKNLSSGETDNLGLDQYPVRSRKSEPSQLTKIAFTLLIIAGIISVCFIVVSTALILWMCLRHRRRKPGKMKSRRSDKWTCSSSCTGKRGSAVPHPRKQTYVKARQEIKTGGRMDPMNETSPLEQQSVKEDQVQANNTQVEYQRILPWRSVKRQNKIRFHRYILRRPEERQSDATKEPDKKVSKRYGCLKGAAKMDPEAIMDNIDPADEDDTRAGMQGPVLPKPQFVVSLNGSVPDTLPPNIHYLPMIQGPEPKGKVMSGELKPAKRIVSEYLEPRQRIIDTTDSTTQVILEVEQEPSNATKQKVSIQPKLSGNFYALMNDQDDYATQKANDYLPLPPPPPTPPPLSPEDIRELLKAPAKPMRTKKEPLIMKNNRTVPRLPPLAKTRKPETASYEVLSK